MNGGLREARTTICRADDADEHCRAANQLRQRRTDANVASPDELGLEVHDFIATDAMTEISAEARVQTVDRRITCRVGNDDLPGAGDARSRTISQPDWRGAGRQRLQFEDREVPTAHQNHDIIHQ
jgi:hypothetical protein